MGGGNDPGAGIVRGGDIGDKLDEKDSWIEIFIDVYMKD